MANGSDVSINSVNNGVVGSSGGSPSSSNCVASNSSWMLGVPTSEFNGPIYGIQFNGNTKVLTASQSGITAGSTYHIKLIVTDVNDGAYDSGVFLKASSFGSPSTLPVSLLGFTAECESNYSHLKWQTATEINNDYFEIEKANHSFNFSTIGQISGVGNSSIVNQYSFQDFEPNNTMVYYRLKQVDYNGDFIYSKPIALNRCTEFDYEIKDVYYSYSTNEINIIYTTNKTTKIQINILDVQGKTVVKEVSDLYQNRNLLKLPVLNLLGGSVYLINIISENSVITKKLLIYSQTY